jgi:hypothetical protein
MFIQTIIQGGPERSGEVLRSYRKFYSEPKIFYKYGSKNASLKSYRPKTSEITVILYIFTNIRESMLFLTNSIETKVVED